MTTHPITPPADRNRSAYRAALMRMMRTWLMCGIGLHVALAAWGADLLGLSIGIWLASGFIAALALAPGCLWPQRAEADRDPSELLLAVAGSMAIRFAGTVALFVLCRYHDGLSAEATAAFVCGWYVLLTAVEVAVLAKQMAGPEVCANRPNAADLSVVPSTGSQSSVTE